MLSILTILVLGFFLGMRHATDPDHVIAVTTIVTKRPRLTHAALVGMVWGLGHTLTIFVVGASIILFKVAIPARVGLSMELAVGFMLIALGVLNLAGIMRWLQEKYLVQHSQAQFVPSPATRGQFPRQAARPDRNEDTHRTENLRRKTDGFGLFTIARPLLVGIVHGLAGSAAVALLVMTTIRDPWWAIAYLLLFGLGTVAGMILITTLIAVPLAFAAPRSSGWSRGVGIASGLLSLCFGLFLFYQIGIVDGLFTAHPQWTPH